MIRKRCLVFLRIKKKQQNQLYQISLARNLRAPGSGSGARQFVWRCYCTFAVLMANYDSISAPWQFIRSRTGQGGWQPDPWRSLSAPARARRSCCHLQTPRAGTAFPSSLHLTSPHFPEEIPAQMALPVQLLLRSQRRCKLETTG